MNLVTDTRELRNAAKLFAGYAEEYTAVYNRLIGAAQTMGDAWSSADNQAFVEQITGICAELKAMASHLELAGKSLDQQAQNYETTRDGNITAVKRLG